MGCPPIDETSTLKIHNAVFFPFHYPSCEFLPCFMTFRRYSNSVTINNYHTVQFHLKTKVGILEQMIQAMVLQRYKM